MVLFEYFSVHVLHSWGQGLNSYVLVIATLAQMSRHKKSINHSFNIQHNFLSVNSPTVGVTQ